MPATTGPRNRPAFKEAVPAVATGIAAINQDFKDSGIEPAILELAKIRVLRRRFPQRLTKQFQNRLPCPEELRSSHGSFDGKTERI
jgi:hypothetical protein